jgi:transposase
MHDRELYSRILEISTPWEVTDVELHREKREIIVHVEWDPSSSLICPECAESCPGYDHRKRRWRHLDTCQYKTILNATVPRVKCPEHGIQQVRVPWSEAGSRFTALFERLVIDWLKQASTSAVAELFGLSWDEVDGVMQRAVARGLSRREQQRPERLGVDETSFQKRHEYVTVMSDITRGVVVDVLDDRTQKTLETALVGLGRDVLEKLDCIAMDMWHPYIKAVSAVVPDAADKIAYDKFHIIKHLSDAVDKVRRQEHRALIAEGIDALKGSKYLWLRGAERLEREEKQTMAELETAATRTARAWSLKELARQLWHYATRGWARKGWRRWYLRAIRSRLEPVKKVARMVWKHIDGVVNGIVKNVTNAKAESINTRIQSLKKTACGFRNRSRFRAAVLFHLGGLDLYPEPEKS